MAKLLERLSSYITALGEKSVKAPVPRVSGYGYKM